MARFIEVNPASVPFGKFTANKMYPVLVDAPAAGHLHRGIKVADDAGQEFYLLESYIKKIHV